MLNNLFVYRGHRVRKVYQTIKGKTFFILFLPFLLGNAYYHYTHYQTIKDNPITYSIIAAVMFLVPAVLMVIVNKLCYEKLFLFSVLDNLRVLSNFIIQNNYYLTTKTTEGKERIKLPKVYLKRDKFGLDVTFILQGNKFQDRFNNMSQQLELMFDGDFMSKTYAKGFVTYTIVLDHIEGRIGIDEVKVDSHGLRLMEDVWWNYDAEPHLLIAGGTGGGKTVLLMSILKGLLEVGYVDIGDPKRLDLTSLKDIPVFRGRVFSTKEEITQMLVDNAKEVHDRANFMANHPEHEIGKNYAAYGLRPKFVLVDEWAAFQAKLGNDYETKRIVDEAFRIIVLEGRQSGVYMITALQRPDGDVIDTDLRDNFMKRISTGYLGDTGNTMLFGDANRDKVFKRIDTINGKKVFGRGYVAVYGQLAQEFYSPAVPFEEGYSFEATFRAMEPLEEQDLTLPNTENNPHSNQENPPENNIKGGTMPENTKPELVSLGTAAKELAVKPKQLLNVILLVEKTTNKPFQRNDAGKCLLSTFDIEALKALYAYKAENDLSWADTVERFF